MNQEKIENQLSSPHVFKAQWQYIALLCVGFFAYITIVLVRPNFFFSNFMIFLFGIVLIYLIIYLLMYRIVIREGSLEYMNLFFRRKKVLFLNLKIIGAGRKLQRPLFLVSKRYRYSTLFFWTKNNDLFQVNIRILQRDSLKKLFLYIDQFTKEVPRDKSIQRLRDSLNRKERVAMRTILRSILLLVFLGILLIFVFYSDILTQITEGL